MDNKSTLYKRKYRKKKKEDGFYRLEFTSVTQEERKILRDVSNFIKENIDGQKIISEIILDNKTGP